MPSNVSQIIIEKVGIMELLLEKQQVTRDITQYCKHVVGTLENSSHECKLAALLQLLGRGVNGSHVSHSMSDCNLTMVAGRYASLYQKAANYYLYNIITMVTLLFDHAGTQENTYSRFVRIATYIDAVSALSVL
jgi:hypothetical protein